MKSKERVFLSLSWNDTDRVPLQIYVTPEIDTLLRNYFKPNDYRKMLGIDLRNINPKYCGKIKPPSDGIIYDMWGTGYKRITNISTGNYDEAVILPLANLRTIEEVEIYPWPDTNAFDYSSIEQQCIENMDYAICVGSAGYPDIVNGVSRGRGMEQVIIDIATRDPVGMAIINKRVDICFQILKKTLQAGRGKIDILCLGEDCGNQNGRMFSEKDFNEVFRPRLQIFIDLAHEFGCKAMMHSCGDTHEIMPTFIEMGLDVLDAMQPEPKGMNPEHISKICKGKLAFCGLISTQNTLPYGTVEQCRAEVQHRLNNIAPGGGYILSPAHCIQPDTPLENILAIYEEVLNLKL